MSMPNQNDTTSTTNQPATPQAPPPTTTASLPTGTAADNQNVPKLDLEASCLALIAGLQANYQSTDVFQMSIGKLTRDDIIAAAQAFINDLEATKAKKQAWSSAVQAERDSLAKLRPVRTAVHVFFQNLLGKGSADLRTYGFEPQKPRQTSVKAKAAGQVQAAETRKARGTKGKKQREAITAPAAATPAEPSTTTAPAAPSKS
jgi:hypothetical protein